MAQLNGGQIQPDKERPERAWGTLFAIPLLTGFFSAFSFFASHPTVCFRNPTAEPIAFYIDGRRTEVVSPEQYVTNSVDYGHHTIGWSSAAETKPSGSVEADVEMSHAHLVNPNEAGCYWIEGASYGAAHVDSKTLGPLPLQSFYTFPKVDLWFTSLPKSISTKQSGETRIALQTYPICMRHMKTCKKEVIREALACDRAASSNEAAEKCWDRCDGDAKPAVDATKPKPATTPTAPVKPVPTTTAKPTAAPTTKPVPTVKK